jgi:hypothetical protein
MTNCAWGAAFAATLCLAACSSNKAATPDAKIIHTDAAIDAPPKVPDAMIDAAPVYDFSCETDGPPTAANATTVTISGTADRLAINGITPSIAAATGISVTLDTNATPPVVKDTQTTDGSGDFTFAAQSVASGSAVDDFVQYATSDTDLGTRVYPEAPLAANQGNVPMLIMSKATYGEVAEFGLGAAPTAGDGALVVAITDCALTPISDAVLEVTQGGTTTEVGTQFALGGIQAQLKGTFIVFNVPAGDSGTPTTVTATYGTHHFHAHVVTSLANYLTATQVRPGT